MKKNKPKDVDTMRTEYDFDYSKAVWGKYAERVAKEGTNVVLLDPDVAEAFPNSESVNATLRAVLEFSSKTREATTPKRRTTPAPRTASRK